ncbi:MAG: sigma-70 family RNA polymerase sigma factor [Planctomycetota bacterium]
MSELEHERTEDLVLQAQAGDTDAREQIMLRFGPRLLQILEIELGPKLRKQVAVEDVLQETLMQAHVYLERFEFRSDATFLDWLVTIGLNVIRTESERWSRKKRDSDRLIGGDAAEETIRRITAHLTGPLSGAMRGEHESCVQKALDALDERHRRVIVLRVYIGLSFAQIAERVGRPTEGAARELFFRARAKLAKEMRRHGLE